MEATFRAIHQERMAGLPFLNSALHVEASGFRLFCGHWLGVLITPWCMNYLLLPGAGGEWPNLPESSRQRWAFPAGELNFIAAREPALGSYQQCPLFASMDNFDSQETAREAAQAALDTLFNIPPTQPVAEDVSHSKRNFLRGRFFGGGGDGSGR
ncbi:MAG: [NiFe]-hydrogenase assembly chaperone HybE [Sulfuricella sp.]